MTRYFFFVFTYPASDNVSPSALKNYCLCSKRIGCRLNLWCTFVLEVCKPRTRQPDARRLCLWSFDHVTNSAILRLPSRRNAVGQSFAVVICSRRWLHAALLLALFGDKYSSLLNLMYFETKWMQETPLNVTWFDKFFSPLSSQLCHRQESLSIKKLFFSRG